MIDYIIVI